MHRLKLYCSTMLCAFLLNFAHPVVAQERGKRVRLRLMDQHVTGRWLGIQGDTLRLWCGDRECRVPSGMVTELQLWNARNPTPVLGLSMLGGIAGMGLNAVISEPMTSVGGDLVIGAGMGLLVGLIDYAIRPGRWVAWSAKP